MMESCWANWGDKMFVGPHAGWMVRVVGMVRMVRIIWMVWMVMMVLMKRQT